MKRFLLSLFSVFVVTMWLCVGQACAQGTAGDIRIRKLNTNRIESPLMKTTDSRATARNYWWQIEVEFETKGGKVGADGNTWHDGMEADITVLIPVRDGKKIMMKRTVSYRDIEDKVSPHVVDFYIRPRFIERYIGRNASYRDVQIFVELRGIGRSSARQDSTGGKSGQWWAVVDTRTVDLRNEELLLRSETPFAPCDYDFYEDVIPSTAGKR